MILSAELPDGTHVKMPGIVPKLSDTPGQVNWQGPSLGQHTAEVMAGLGLTGGDIERLKEQGVIQ
jgi:crotonobetainyl-CoA:carnitine CoA-transferase CaiB-like acyl-CoA transferase